MAIKLGQGLRRGSSGDVPGGGVPRDPGLRIPKGAFGEFEAQALEQAGADVANLANQERNQQLAAQARVQDRQDQIQNVRGARDFNETVLKKFSEIQDTDDISLQETQSKFRGVVDTEMARVGGAFIGSQAGRDKMQLRLEQMGSKFLDESAQAGEKEQRRILGQQIDEDIKAQIDNVQADPSMLQESLVNIDRILADNQNVLTPEQEDAFKSGAKSQVYTQTINTNLFQGSIDEAIDLINTPAARRALGPEKVQEFRTRIKKFEDSREDDPGLQDKITEFETAVGRPATEKEISQFAGLKNDPAQANKAQQFMDGIKILQDMGVPLSQEQINQGAATALGISLTGTQAGEKEAEALIAKNQKLRAAGELPAGASDLVDESGNLKNEVSNSISARISESMGGEFNSETGKSTGLSPEQAALLPILSAEAGKLVLNGEVNDINQAIQITMAGKDIPKAKTFSQTGIDIVQEIATPTDKSIASDAALFDKVDLDNATGAASAIVDFWGRTLGQASNDFVDVKKSEDRNRLKMLAHEFILANKRSDRLPVFEQKRLEAIFSGPGILESGEATRAVFRSLDDQLTEDLNLKQKMLAIDGIPGKEKQEILMDVLTLSRFQKKLRTFNMTPGGKDAVVFETPEEITDSSDKDFNKFMRRQSKSSFNALAPDVKQAIRDRAAGEKPAAEPEAQKEANPAQVSAITELNDEELAGAIEDAKKRKHFLLGTLESELKSRKGKK